MAAIRSSRRGHLVDRSSCCPHRAADGNGSKFRKRSPAEAGYPPIPARPAWAGYLLLELEPEEELGDVLWLRSMGRDLTCSPGSLVGRFSSTGRHTRQSAYALPFGPNGKLRVSFDVGSGQSSHTRSSHMRRIVNRCISLVSIRAKHLVQ